MSASRMPQPLSSADKRSGATLRKVCVAPAETQFHRYSIKDEKPDLCDVPSLGSASAGCRARRRAASAPPAVRLVSGHRRHVGRLHRRRREERTCRLAVHAAWPHRRSEAAPETHHDAEDERRLLLARGGRQRGAQCEATGRTGAFVRSSTYPSAARLCSARARPRQCMSTARGSGGALGRRLRRHAKGTRRTGERAGARSQRRGARRPLARAEHLQPRSAGLSARDVSAPAVSGHWQVCGWAR